MSVFYFNTGKTLLDDFAIQRRNSADMMIADRVAPPVPVDINSKAYPIWDDGNSLVLPVGQGIRGNGSTAEEVAVKFSTGVYNTTEKAIQDKLDIRELENAQPELQVSKQYIQTITDKQMLLREYLTAQKMFSASNFSSYTSALNSYTQWDLSATNGNDPRIQVNIAKQSIRKNGVVDPDQISLVCGSDVYQSLLYNTLLLKSVNYTIPFFTNKEQLAQVLGVKEILVGTGVYQNATTGTKNSIWSGSALFMYLNQAATLMDVSCAKTFILREHDLRIENWYENNMSSWIYRAKWDYDIELTAVSSGYLFTSAVSTAY